MPCSSYYRGRPSWRLPTTEIRAHRVRRRRRSPASAVPTRDRWQVSLLNRRKVTIMHHWTKYRRLVSRLSGSKPSFTHSVSRSSGTREPTHRSKYCRGLRTVRGFKTLRYGDRQPDGRRSCGRLHQFRDRRGDQRSAFEEACGFREHRGFLRRGECGRNGRPRCQSAVSSFAMGTSSVPSASPVSWLISMVAVRSEPVPGSVLDGEGFDSRLDLLINRGHRSRYERSVRWRLPLDLPQQRTAPRR